MGKLDLKNLEPPERVRVGGVDTERMKIFRKRFPPAAKRRLYIRDHILFPQRDPPPNPEKADIPDAAALTGEIKALISDMGAHDVGVAAYEPKLTFAGVEPVDHKAVIVFGMAMEYDFMADIGPKSQDEVHRVYFTLDDIGNRIAQEIAGYGYQARVHPNAGDFPLPAYGQLAGLGELGKHGSLISPKMGSTFRLCAVSTDLPLVVDGPKDHGIDEVCAKCGVCERFCPGDAIKPGKKVKNGVERWIVERELCEPYFHKLYGCKICLMVCPLNAKGAFRDAFKTLSRDLVKARDAAGLLDLIEERTEFHAGDFDASDTKDDDPGDAG